MTIGPLTGNLPRPDSLGVGLLAPPDPLSDSLSSTLAGKTGGGAAGTDPGLWRADDSGAALSYYIGLSHPIGIGLDPQAPPTTGPSFALPPPTFGDASSSSVPQSGPPSLDFFAGSLARGGPGGGGGGGGGSPPPPLLQHYGTGALQFDVTYDSNVTGSRNASQIESAFGNAIGYFTTNFTPLGGAITVNLNVGWGEVDKLALPSNALGASFTNLETVDYSQFADILNQSGNVSSMPTTTSGDPLTGTTHTYALATAEAKAIGLSVPAGTIDGWVGFSSSAAWYFGSGAPTRVNQYDFIGIAEHEISEAMGRIAQVGTTAYLNGDVTGATTAANAYTPFDLFRFSDINVRSLTGGNAAHFSYNGGANNLGTFNTTAGGDFGDWQVPSTINLTSPNDAYDAGSYAGVQYAASANDKIVMDALGYGTI